MDIKELLKKFRVEGKKLSLEKDFDTSFSPKSLTKESAQPKMQEGLERLAEMQDRLYADNSRAVLCIFQAMDAAGKDSTIKHVYSGVNPQGCQVFSFKVPSDEELDHDYLWRYSKCLPERGRIGIFNRSYYEEVLVVKVHPVLLERQHMPEELKDDGIWKRRYKEINSYEQYLSDQGITILKFFLHVSKEEQKKRFMDRIEDPTKNWKFGASDVEERRHWDEYMAAYEEMLAATSTKAAPWYVIPADKKWFMRLAVSMVIGWRIEQLNLKYPKITETQRLQLLQSKALLDAEDE